jgi:Fe-S cluster assembly ATPase SufC
MSFERKSTKWSERKIESEEMAGERRVMNSGLSGREKQRNERIGVQAISGNMEEMSWV